jgi:hypothetical protein
METCHKTVLLLIAILYAFKILLTSYVRQLHLRAYTFVMNLVRLTLAIQYFLE